MSNHQSFHSPAHASQWLSTQISIAMSQGSDKHIDMMDRAQELIERQAEIIREMKRELCVLKMQINNQKQ